MRRSLDRKKARDLRERIYLPAVKIQSRIRGKFERQRHKKRAAAAAGAATSIQRAWRKMVTDKKGGRQDAAARLLQRAFRGKSGRQDANDRERAISTLQQTFKGNKMRSQVLQPGTISCWVEHSVARNQFGQHH